MVNSRVFDPATFGFATVNWLLRKNRCFRATVKELGGAGGATIRSSHCYLTSLRLRKRRLLRNKLMVRNQKTVAFMYILV